jgi:hypothetical protein
MVGRFRRYTVKAVEPMAIGEAHIAPKITAAASRIGSGILNPYLARIAVVRSMTSRESATISAIAPSKSSS